MKRVGISVIITALIGWLANYFFLPAWNIHSFGCWAFVLFLMFVFSVSYLAVGDFLDDDEFITPTALGIAAFGILGWFVATVVIGVAGGKLPNATRYAELLEVEEGDWDNDMPAVESVTNVALMDTRTAQVFGERALSSLSKVVSRYDLDEFTQINQNGKAMKVAPLQYDSFWKWNKYKTDGIPGYVLVDPVNTTAEYVELDEAIKYSPSENFRRDLHRTLRRQYPNDVMGDHYFELDEEGHPYYITPVYKYTIGLWGGEVIDSVIILDACTGESEKIAVSDVPEWVDVVYDGDYICELYNYYGTLSNGYWNSVFSQTDCKKCTDDYGYVTIGNDIWVYTGVTSVVGDSSNIGLIMANERTGKTKYYNVGGADERSAMGAAEGEVANFGYQASFPSVVNVNGEPTYIMVLTDNNSIVKEYAMVNLANYSKIAVADTQKEVFAEYAAKMGFASSEEQEVEEAEPEETVDTVSKTITVTDMEFIVSGGNTCVYFLDDAGNQYKMAFDERFLFASLPFDLTVQVKPDETADVATIYALE